MVLNVDMLGVCMEIVVCGKHEGHLIVAIQGGWFIDDVE